MIELILQVFDVIKYPIIWLRQMFQSTGTIAIFYGIFAITLVISRVIAPAVGSADPLETVRKVKDK